LPKSPKLPKIAEIEKAKPHHGSTRVTLIGKNKTFETQRNRGHGGARISADQKGKHRNRRGHGGTKRNKQRTISNFGDVGNSGDSGNSTDPAACIE